MLTSAIKIHPVSQFGNEINHSLRARLEKLEQALAFAGAFVASDNQPGATLGTLIKKTAEKPGCLEMFRELAEEEPTTDIKPQTVINLLQRKITELKKALAALSEASN